VFAFISTIVRNLFTVRTVTGVFIPDLIGFHCDYCGPSLNLGSCDIVPFLHLRSKKQALVH
jgi:hypothetical protein